MLPDLLFKITAEGDTASAFGKTRDQLGQIGATFAAVRREAGLAKSLLAGFAGGLGFGLISSLGEIPAKFREIVSEGADLVSTASHIGITTDELQKLQYAAQLAHVDVGTLNSALDFFSRTTADAAAGGAERFRATLQANGIALRDNQGRLRPLTDLFADYLDLLGRAKNQQDKNLLSVIAFGKGNSEMGDLAEKGGEGVKKAGDELERMGGILDRVELDKLKAIDDAFARTAAGLEAFAKRAAVSAIAGATAVGGEIQTISSDLTKFENSPTWDNLMQVVFGNWHLAGKSVYPYPEDPEIAARKSQSAVAESYPEDPGIAARRSSAPSSAAPAVVPPPPGSGVDTLKKRYDDLTASLKLQLAALTETDREQYVAAEVAKLGTKATQEQKDAVAALAGEYYDGKKALEDFNQESQFFGDAIFQALDGMLIKGEDATQVLKDLVAQLAEAALQAALLGQGPLASLFGTAPKTGVSVGGLLGALFGGFRADGGAVTPGKAYIVGERGPELFTPGAPGMISNRGGDSGGSIVVSYAPVFNGPIDTSMKSYIEGRIRLSQQELVRQIPSIVAAKKQASPAYLRP